MRKLIIIFLIVLSCPLSVFSIGGNTNFLPMEDAMSAARNAPVSLLDNTKPYRQSFSMISEDREMRDYFDFTSSDILAFVLLAGIYIVFVKKDAKSRNASF